MLYPGINVGDYQRTGSRNDSDVTKMCHLQKNKRNTTSLQSAEALDSAKLIDIHDFESG